MVDVFAAAGVQFRRSASGREHRRLLAHRSALPSVERAPTVEPVYEPIEMPRNSPTGFICAFFATFAGFGMIWQIWWLVIVALIGAFATFVVFAWRDRTEYEIPGRGGRSHRSRQSPCARRNARDRGGPVMTAFQAGADYGDGRREEARRPAAASRFRSQPTRHRNASLSATASGSSCSATSSCSRRFSPPMRCSPARPREGRAAKICSTCTMSRSRPPASCFRVSPAAWPRSARGRITASCTTAAWRRLACSDWASLRSRSMNSSA